MTTKLNDPSLKDVEPGSDADASPASNVNDAPGENDKSDVPAPADHKEGAQEDDNVDDQGNKAGGGKLDQPT